MKSSDYKSFNIAVIPEGNINEEFFSYIISLGINTVVLSIEHLESIQLANKLGLHVFIKLHHLPNIMDEKVESYGIYWESPLFSQDLRKELLQRAQLRHELFQIEIAKLESHKPFYYVLPEIASQNLKLHLNQIQELAFHTLIKNPLVFSAYDGPSDGDYLPINPLWKVLNNRMIPLFAIGRNDTPLFLMDAIRKFFLKNLSGACLKVSVPLSRFSKANLFMSLQALINKMEPEQSLCKWFCENEPESEMEIQWIEDLHPCIAKLAYFKASQKIPTQMIQEEIRWHVEEFIGFCKRLEKNFENIKRKYSIQSRKLTFLHMLEMGLYKTKQEAKQTLVHHQISLPQFLQD